MPCSLVRLYLLHPGLLHLSFGLCLERLRLLILVRELRLDRLHVRRLGLGLR
jgi:hypothetical protein